MRETGLLHTCMSAFLLPLDKINCTIDLSTGCLDGEGCLTMRALPYCTLLMQRLGDGDVGSGIQVGTLAGGAFTITTFPNLAMSVPLAGLRLRHQRRERADAALSRAKSAGVLPGSPCVVSASHEPRSLSPPNLLTSPSNLLRKSASAGEVQL